MKNFGFEKLMVFLILSGTVAFAYQIPFLSYNFYDQMMAAMHLNDIQIGVLSTAVNTTSTLCYPIGGFLANRFSMRSLIIATLVGFVGLTLWFALTTNYIALIAIHILYGFFGVATLWSAYLSGIRNLGDESIQSKLFGSSEAIRGIMQTLVGFAFLGMMSVSATPILGFRNVLLLSSGIIGVLLVMAFIFLPKGDIRQKAASAQDTGQEVQDEKYTCMDVMRHKGVWITVLLCMCGYVAWKFGNGYLTTYTVRVVGISDSMASTIGVFRTYIIVTLAGFFGGWFLDKFTYKGKGFIMLFSITATLFVGVLLTNKVVPLCIGLTLLAAFVFNVMKSTYWSTMGQAGIPLKMTPLATGLMSFIIYMPSSVGPPIFGYWLQAAGDAGDISVGFNKVFMVIIGFAIMGIVSGFILMKRTQAIEQGALLGDDSVKLKQEIA